MKNENLDVKLIWIQFEDHLVPQLRLNVVDRAVYSHLFRHSRLIGRRRLRFSIAWLARGTRLCDGPVRMAVRRLVAKGALRLIERSKAGHLVELRLPEEIRAAGAHNVEGGSARAIRAANIEEIDFLKTKALRQAIHAREHGLCFYCQRRTSGDRRCLDHVVSLVNLGGQFPSKSGFLLCGMQLAEGRNVGRGFPSLALSRGAADGNGTHRASARP